MTRQELMQELKSKGIKFDISMTKSELEELLDNPVNNSVLSRADSLNVQTDGKTEEEIMEKIETVSKENQEIKENSGAVIKRGKDLTLHLINQEPMVKFFNPIDNLNPDIKYDRLWINGVEMRIGRGVEVEVRKPWYDLLLQSRNDTAKALSDIKVDYLGEV